MFEQLMNSEVLFRLNQEGYVLLVTLLIVFTISIFVANVLAQVFAVSIYFFSFCESVILGFTGKFKKKERSA